MLCWISLASLNKGPYGAWHLAKPPSQCLAPVVKAHSRPFLGRPKLTLSLDASKVGARDKHRSKG